MQNDSEQANELKNEGNALFVKKDYVGASAKYTEAIALDASNAILYANRSACRLNLRRYMDAVSDAEEAIKINPTYAKAYARLASAQDALGQFSVSVETWSKAINALPKTDSSNASSEVAKQQKKQYEACLAVARAYDQVSNDRANVYVIPNTVHEDLPWKCALRKVPELERNGNFISSAWVISAAYLEFEEGVRLMKSASIWNGVMVFSTSVVTAISNAILADSRAFHITDPEWVSRYNQQVMAEAQMTRAWVSAGPDVIKREALERLRVQGWDAVRPALSITIRCWILHGFAEGGFKGNQTTNVECLARAIEIIKWGRNVWADASTDNRGVIFAETFLRGVQSRHLDALMQLIKQSRGEIKKTLLEELMVECDEVLNSVANQAMPPRENDPSFVLAFWDYTKGQALAMQGFYYAQKAIEDESQGHSAAAIANVRAQASLAYTNAAKCYPEDEEQYLWYMIVAVENQMKNKAPVRLQLSTFEHIWRSLEQVKTIWNHSDLMNSGIRNRLEPLRKVEVELRRLVDEGKVSLDSCVGATYDGGVVY